jgi:hypothetical protein
MFRRQDIELTEFENKLLQEEKFELGYRLGITEGLSAALEAILQLNMDNGIKTKITPEVIEKLREIQADLQERHSSNPAK